MKWQLTSCDWQTQNQSYLLGLATFATNKSKKPSKPYEYKSNKNTYYEAGICKSESIIYLTNFCWK